MTNTSASMNCAFTALVTSKEATEQDRELSSELFSLIGAIEFVEEKNLDALTALTGAAPAFFLSLMEAAALGGIHAGLPKALAYKGSACALIAAANLLLQGEKHAAAIRDDICTPGGMTIEGISELEQSGARGTMMRAIVKTAEKGKALTEKLLSSLK